jgi:hypothetical protein
MGGSSEVLAVARRLDALASRVAELGDRPAQRLSAAEWRCPRGRRALMEAEALGGSARRAAGRLAEAAQELAGA